MNEVVRTWLLIALPLVAAAGCNTLPPGPVASVKSLSTSARSGEVYIFRGWRGLWSEGMDALADELRHEGVEAQVFRADQSSEVQAALVQAYGRPGPHDPLVLIGFSFGADESIRIANALGNRGIEVNLLITLDPVTPPPLPRHVKACLDFYEPSLTDALPWLRGVAMTEQGPPSGACRTSTSEPAPTSLSRISATPPSPPAQNCATRSSEASSRPARINKRVRRYLPEIPSDPFTGGRRWSRGRLSWRSGS